MNRKGNNMKERMLKNLKTLANAVTVEELCEEIGSLTVEEIKEVQEILNEMVQKG